MTDPQSPCIRNCCLNKEDVCVGCGRLLQEILDWQKVDNSERQEILLRSKQRLLQLPIHSNKDQNQ